MKKLIKIHFEGETYYVTERTAMMITAIGFGTILGLFLGLLLTEQDA